MNLLSFLSLRSVFPIFVLALVLSLFVNHKCQRVRLIKNIEKAYIKKQESLNESISTKNKINEKLNQSKIEQQEKQLEKKKNNPEIIEEVPNEEKQIDKDFDEFNILFVS